MQQLQHHQQSRGAVSLFVVIFTAILLSIVTLSFIQMMVRDQQQATRNDLSQSAADSAQAGIEDAKRVLLLNQACQSSGSVSPACQRVKAAINSDSCNSVADALVLGPGEVKVQESSGPNGGGALDQAYTCVKIALDTPDYLYTLSPDQSVVIPLTGASGFNGIRISWFMSSDITTGSARVVQPRNTSKLLQPSAWDPATPSLMEAQVINLGKNFQLSQLDSDGAHTLFLMSAQNGIKKFSMGLDPRKVGTKTPQGVNCDGDVAAGGYACSATIRRNGNDNFAANAFLHLTALYNATHIKVELLQGNAVVPFHAVQPEVDSTGRANDLFRRIEARVQLGSTTLDPSISVGNFCKTFSVTGDRNGYDANDNRCTP